ncbi:MAG: hypothetical protein RR572_01195 [Raoultibacter sp.]
MNRRPLGASLALCVALAACVLAPLAFANEAPATQTSPTPPEKPSLVVAAPTTHSFRHCSTHPLDHK